MSFKFGYDLLPHPSGSVPIKYRIIRDGKPIRSMGSPWLSHKAAMEKIESLVVIREAFEAKQGK